jgi:ABC-type dipeptide/oligopeptide/nickel transport system permease subunit
MVLVAFNFLFILSIIIGLVFFEAPVNVDLLQSSEKAFQSWKHPLGCDRLGRDIYALYAFGTFTTFLISIPARGITLFFSVCISFLSYASNKYINFIIGKAVQIANLSIYEFQKECQKSRIPVVDYEPDELKEEFALLKQELL